MTEKNNNQEIEIISTVEIHHIYGPEDLAALSDHIPMTQSELAAFKKDFAEAISREIEACLDADAVNVANVQYFEYEVPAEPETKTVTEE